MALSTVYWKQSFRGSLLSTEKKKCEGAKQNCSKRHFYFFPLSFEEFYVNPLPRENSYEISSLIFIENNENMSAAVVIVA